MRLSVVLDSVDPAGIADFWQLALGYRRAGELASFVVLLPAGDADAPGAPVVLLQKVREQPAGKNRMHLDLHPPDVHAHVARLEALGGRRVGGPVTELLATAGVWWQVMADPQGNEFCVVADPGHAPPADG